jgi:hypothetical protein
VPAAGSPKRRAASTLLVATNPTIAVARAHGHGRVGALGAAEGEVDQVRPAGRQAAAGGLGGDRGLEGDLIQQGRLDQLGLSDGGGDLQQRLPRQHHPALGHRPHVPAEAQLGQGVQGRRIQAQVGLQPVQLLGREPEALQELQAVRQARRDQEAPVGWEVADEEAEGGGGRHPAPQVDHGHVELIEVGQQPAAAVAFSRSLCIAHPNPASRTANANRTLPPWPASL